MFKAIHYCLQMYFKTLETSVLKYMNSILLIFLSVSGLAWQACFKRTKVELELLTNIDMLLMVGKGIRGGICHAIHRYANANNKYMKNYDKNIERSSAECNSIECNSVESLYLMYLDANNLYGGESLKNCL